MPAKRDRSGEHARRKAFAALNNLCLRCNNPRQGTAMLCPVCAQKKNAKSKRAREARQAIGLCKCGNPAATGYKLCQPCIEKTNAIMQRTRTGYRESGGCLTCGKPVTTHKTCKVCRDRATKSTMKRYRNNIALKKCSTCGGDLNRTTFRCDTCNNTHTFRTFVTWHKRRKKVFKHYGGKCVCCGITTPEFLEVDHVNNDGKEHRKTTGRHVYTWIIKNGFPTDLQLLCANCNRSKSKLGVCAHAGPEHISPAPSKKAEAIRRRRIRTINQYGGACKCCGESNYAFLEFDHINGNGRQHRIELNRAGTKLIRWIIRHNYPDSIQLLCSNCNRAKYQCGKCPHQHDEPFSD